MKEGEGCIIKDIDGNHYIDYVASYGPLIVGHTNERVVAALSKAIGRGTSFGAPTELETQLAATIISAIPSVEMVRFVNSGTEAAMSAVRLARAATGRDLVVKCIGCYHGHVDGLLVEAGSGAQAVFEKYPGQIACFAVEPIAGNMGVVSPVDGYLQGLRELCDQHGTMLLFDEVMTGFRVAWGGAQTLYNVRPDLTCLGKVIGGGLPVGAYGGSKKLMELVSPAGPVYQAGTLSGNPLAMSGGLATLEILQEPGTYEALERLGARLADGLAKSAASAGVQIAINRVGTMVGLFFVREQGQKVTNFTQATACDTAAFARYFHAMLDQGIYLAPSMFEAMFVGTAHTTDAIDRTIQAAGKAFAASKQVAQ
jgi:glutamate-1-semialdehyde 2,1-aminomutase